MSNDKKFGEKVIVTRPLGVYLKPIVYGILGGLICALLIGILILVVWRIFAYFDWNFHFLYTAIPALLAFVTGFSLGFSDEFGGGWPESKQRYNTSLHTNRVALGAGNSSKSTVPKAQEHFDKGMMLIELQQPLRKAIKEFSKAIKLDPKFAAAYIKRGDVLCNLAFGPEYLSIKMLHDAFVDFTMAKRLDPKNVRAYISRASCNIVVKDFETAIPELTEAINLDPNSSEAHCERGIALFANNAIEKAISDLSEAIRLDPDNSAAYFYRGRALQAKGQDTPAKADFVRAKELGWQE